MARRTSDPTPPDPAPTDEGPPVPAGTPPQDDPVDDRIILVFGLDENLASLADAYGPRGVALRLAELYPGAFPDQRPIAELGDHDPADDIGPVDVIEGGFTTYDMEAAIKAGAEWHRTKHSIPTDTADLQRIIAEVRS